MIAMLYEFAICNQQAGNQRLSGSGTPAWAVLAVTWFVIARGLQRHQIVNQALLSAQKYMHQVGLS
jgi:hypothetical protein